MRRQAFARNPGGVRGDALSLQAFANVETRTMQVKGNPVVFARRPPDTVWHRLADILGADLVDAGERLTEIYAEMMGLAGAPERDPGMPMTKRDDPTNLPTRMLEANRRWAAIMAEFSRGSVFPAMFQGLCMDIMEGEFSPMQVPGKPKRSRWRTIVAGVTRVDNRNGQGVVVVLGCRELAQIMADLGL